MPESPLPSPRWVPGALIPDLKERVQGIVDGIGQDPEFHGFDAVPLRNVRVLSASPGNALFALTIVPALGNKNSVLHGGAAATLLDDLTSCCLFTIARPGYWEHGGVTRTLNVTCLKPIKIGEEVQVKCHVVGAGKRMCMLRGEIIGANGDVCMTVEHGRVSTEPLIASNGKL